MRYRFNVVVVHNPSDEWYMVVRATENATGQQWELLDSLQRMPQARVEYANAYMADLLEDPPTEPTEYWREW